MKRGLSLQTFFVRLKSQTIFDVTNFIMKKTIALTLAVSSIFLAGCHKAGVQFADLRNAPVVTVTNDVVTIHFQGVYLGAETWAAIKSSVENTTLCVSGSKTSSEPDMDHDYTVKLTSAVNPQSLNVVWLNPDGSRVPIPLAK